MVPPLITLEEHFLSKHIEGSVDFYNTFRGPLVQKLLTFGEERLRDLDAGKVSLQVISHAPENGTPAQCRAANDELAEACRNNAKRYAGFAMLPMLEPSAAAEELERSVKQLGFVGALINNTSHSQFYDEEKYWTVFERAVELDVPVYLHPSFPSDEMAQHYKGNYPDRTAFWLSISGWGWHTEIGLHVLRLFASGLFDKLPKLKIIIGHMGEMVPFAFDRMLPLSKFWGERQRDLRTVWDENIWVTTSAYFTLAPLACLLQVSKIDKIMYSVDYPFSSNEKGLPFIEAMQKSDLVNDEQLEMICFKNAEKLLRVKAQS